MTDFSRPPLELLLENRNKGYVGLHIEQGVPLLDRDLNLLHDLIVAEVRALFSRFVGDGVPAASDGFAIVPATAPTQNFTVTAGPDGGPGSCLVGGLDVPIAAKLDYTAQTTVVPPPLTTPGPADANPREDTVYLDAWIVEVDAVDDPTLANAADVGMATSTRLAVRWAVRVAEGKAAASAPDRGHQQYPLARLRRPRGVATIDAGMITDLRQRRLTVADLERRLALAERVLLLPAFATGPGASFPPFGAAGQQIQINGVNLDVGTLQVFFGDQLAAIVAPSATQVVSTVPGGLTPDGNRAAVPITLSNEGGKAVSATLFEVRPLPVFVKQGQQFNPPHASAGAPVTLFGSNFNSSDAVVTIGPKQARIVPGSATSTQVTVLVPAGLVPAGGTPPRLKITVTNSFGATTTPESQLFQVDPDIPAPTLDTQNGISPGKGPVGATIVLNGQNLNNDPKVTFGAASAPTVGPTSSTQISVQVPTLPPGSVTITVTTPSGSATGPFTVTG